MINMITSIEVLQEKVNSIEADSVIDFVGWDSCNIVISSCGHEKWPSLLGFLL